MHKRVLLFLFIVVGTQAFAQMQPVHSVSLRLGAPVGVTFKTYIGKKEAVEFGIGGASPYWNHTYYVNSFNSVPKFENFHYIDHSVSNTIYLQGRYLKDFAIPTSGMEGALSWYCGVGGVLKFASVTYRYTDVQSTPPTQTGSRTDIDFGPEAILGGEYWMDNAPFSFYLEGSAMLEVFDRIGGRAFAAVGARYHFMR